MSRAICSVAWGLLLIPLGAAAQDTGDANPADANDAYLDPTAQALHVAAVRHWQEIDESVLRYTATVQQRLAAQLRTPLKDRTLYRSEQAGRVFWDREHDNVIQMLAAREQTPAGVTLPEDFTTSLRDFFDPAGDRLFFGAERSDPEEDAPAGSADESDGDYVIYHPLHDDAAAYYRFESGDTLTLTLPDGRILQVVELVVLPAVADAHRITGSLWVEPESGALVRAAYRLADRFDALRDIPDLEEEEGVGYVPGFLKPWTFDLQMVMVDYALWDFAIWLPRSFRVEGVVGAGILKGHATFETSYRIESVVTEADLEREAAGEPPIGVFEEHHFETRAEAMRFLASLMAEEEGVPVAPEGDFGGDDFIIPVDPNDLLVSPHLPPPVWDDAPGFPTDDEIEAVEDILSDLPQVNPTRTSWAANWGLERPDLVRYNRVEGPSLGGRFALRTGSPLGPVSLEAEPYFGIADVEPKIRLGAEWESVRRRTTISAYRELQSAVRLGDHLGLGNSVTSLFWGRDDGEYFLASGMDLVLRPASALRQSWSVRFYGEYHESVERHTDFTVFDAFDDDFSFRPNIEAEQGAEYGVEVALRPWWGTDPLAPQLGGELYLNAATGDVDFVRASALLRAAVPFSLTSNDQWRIAVEGEVGESWGGDLPVQRSWFLGSAETLRGYQASSLVGPAFARARAEVARVFPVVSLAVFSDAGWTADRVGDLVQRDGLVSLGVGASVLDGLIRLDVARGLRGIRDTRWDFYLDAAF